MADNNKAVGSLAAAKLVTLIKAETAKKYDKTGGKIEGSAEITGGLKVGMSSEFSSSIKAGSEISSDMLLMAPIVALHDPTTEESISFGVSGENAAKVTSPVSGGGTQYARLAVGTPTGDNDAATKAYVDGRTHDYYDVTVTSSAGAAQTIDGGIISVHGSADKTVAEISAAYASGMIVRCIYGGNTMQLSRVADGSFTFAGIGANYGVARSGNITITIMSTSNGDVTLITSAAGELPIPDSDVSQNGCVLVVGNGQWMYSADKFIPATPTSNGLMSAADKTKLDSIDSVCYDIYAKIGDAYTHDSVYKYGCTVSRTFAEINAAVHAGKTPRVLLVNDINNPSDTRIICPLSEYDTSRSEGGYYFDAPGLVGVSGSGRIYIDENGAMYTCSAGELPAVDENQDGKYLTIDGGMWTYRRPDVATTAEPGFMSAKDKSKLDGVEDGANKTVVDAALDASSTNPVQNKAVKAALDEKAGTEVATTSANGLMSATDKTKLDSVEYGANKTTVDAALDAASENPVQNKAVKAALDGKLSTLGGEISGHLSVGLTVSAEGSVSVGRTSADTGIHFEKAASDAGRISHGSDPMTGVSPIARLKVATPTEDDDAATKAYVDNNAAVAGAVRYDAAQTLEVAQQFQARTNIGAVGYNSPQFQGFLALAPANAPLGTGVGLSPSGSGNDFTLDISDVNEGTPTLLTGVKTPTDADTNAAATVAYVKNKVASSGSSDFVANGTFNQDGTVTLDKTLGQIQEAFNSGKKVFAHITIGTDSALMPLTQISTGAAKFGAAGTDNLFALVSELVVTPNITTLAVMRSPTLTGDAKMRQVSMLSDPASDMQIATKKYVDDHAVSLPLTLTYANGQATGASYSEIRKAIESGRQIKLAVANKIDIIASQAKNKTDRSDLIFIETNVGGGSALITQYWVIAQASGITAYVESWETT